MPHPVPRAALAALLLALPAAAQPSLLNDAPPVGQAPLPRVITPDSDILAGPDSASPTPSGYSPDQLAAMLAPIALYPDTLLAQMLMASEHPDQLAEAQAWRAEPDHQRLAGAELAAAVTPLGWDPSVKSLLPFPAQLASLAEHPDWAAGLAWAFAHQQPDLLDSVQRLREQAVNAGTLASGPAISVRTEPAPDDDGSAPPLILIQPTDPGVVMVPSYDPVLAFGIWGSPAFPPMRLPPTTGAPGLNPGYGFGLAPPMGFGPGVAVGGLAGGLWGLGQPVWAGPGWHGPSWRGAGRTDGGPHIARDPDRWNRLAQPNVLQPAVVRPAFAQPATAPRDLLNPGTPRPNFVRPTFAQPPAGRRLVPDFNGQYRRERAAPSRPASRPASSNERQRP